MPSSVGGLRIETPVMSRSLPAQREGFADRGTLVWKDLRSGRIWHMEGRAGKPKRGSRSVQERAAHGGLAVRTHRVMGSCYGLQTPWDQWQH